MVQGATPNGRNLLLTALNGGHDDPQLRSLELVGLELRQILYEPDAPIDYVYFPVDGVLSLLAHLEDGVEIEVGTVGNEGMVGLPVFLGSLSTPGRAFSQVPGKAYRMAAGEFQESIKRPSRLTAVLHRYTQALMVQISQGNGCNRVHSNEQRCARWLLLTADRVGGPEFPMTQDFLSQMLGVRRATVSEVAGRLQAAEMIEYSRGVIRILDRERLEAASCGCYRVIRREYDRMYDELR